MKFEVDIIHNDCKDLPGSWLAVTTYRVHGKTKSEAIMKAVMKFKKRLQLKRFMYSRYTISAEEIK